MTGLLVALVVVWIGQAAPAAAPPLDYGEGNFQPYARLDTGQVEHGPTCHAIKIRWVVDGQPVWWCITKEGGWVP